MAVMVFRSCCGCMSLRTGCIVIGVLELIHRLVGTTDTPKLLMIPLGLFGAIACVLLIIGALMQNHSFLWPYIAVNIVSVVGCLVAVFLGAFAPALTKGKSSSDRDESNDIGSYFSSISTFFVLLGIIVDAVCILVVYSHICELREEELPQNGNSSPPAATAPAAPGPAPTILRVLKV